MEKEKAGEQGIMVKKTEPQLASEHLSQRAWGFSCRYSPGPVAGKALSFQLQHSSSLQSHSPLAEEQQEEGLLTDPTEKRFVALLPARLLQGVLVTGAGWQLSQSQTITHVQSHVLLSPTSKDTHSAPAGNRISHGALGIYLQECWSLSFPPLLGDRG